MGRRCRADRNCGWDKEGSGLALAEWEDGSLGDHVAACQGQSGRRIGDTCERNRLPDFGSQVLVEDGAGMYPAAVQGKSGTAEVGILSAGR